jgi:GT2 family glycosyltransferase
VLRDEPVPGNRWDLLRPDPGLHPDVSVVVVHYNQPAQLARTHRALSRQTLPPVEIVIADDGSAVLPVLPAGGPPTTVVSQPDQGFRAGAARNLAVARCRGEVLVFLDADTTPDPDFIRALTRRVAMNPDLVAVGRRRHADLRGLPAGGDPGDAPGLPEPAWLREAYGASRNLLHADGRSFRYMISAVLACRTALFTELGGFDERFVGYGGEDWDFAYRAWNAGAVFIHEPGAVAWHDGPDWAGRPDAAGSHDRQSLRLAALIPEPRTRGAPLPHARPDVLVDLEPDLDAGGVARAVHSLLRQDFRDLRVRLSSPLDPLVAEVYGRSVRVAPWDPDQLRRARARLTVGAPLPPDALGRAMHRLVHGDLGIVTMRTSGATAATLTSTRAEARARRWAERLSSHEVMGGHFGIETLDVGPAPPAHRELAQYFCASWT